MTEKDSPEGAAFQALNVELMEVATEVRACYTAYRLNGRQLDQEQWSQMQSKVHSVGDLLRDLMTIHNENRHSAQVEEIIAGLDGDEGFQALVEAAISSDLPDKILDARVIEKFSDFSAAERSKAKQWLADELRAAVMGSLFPRATRLALVNKAINEIPGIAHLEEIAEYVDGGFARDEPEVGDAGTGHGAYEYRSGN